MELGRRRILRVNLTDHPGAEWTQQQLREGSLPLIFEQAPAKLTGFVGQGVLAGGGFAIVFDLARPGSDAASAHQRGNEYTQPRNDFCDISSLSTAVPITYTGAHEPCVNPHLSRVYCF
jgi:hypothetical protein